LKISHLLANLLIVSLLSISAFSRANAETMALLARTDVVAPAFEFSPETKQWLAAHSVIRIGVWDNIPQPLYMDFQSGVFEGLSADYLKIIGTSLGRKIVIRHYPDRESMLAALNEGEIDLLAYYSPAANESEHLAMSAPYLLLKAVLVYRKGTQFDDQYNLKGKSITFRGDEHLGSLLRAHYPQARVVDAASDSISFTSVMLGQNDVMWTSNATAAYFFRQGHRDILATIPSLAAPNLNASFATTPENAALTQAISTILSKVPLRSAVRIAETWGLDYDFVVKNHQLDLTSDEATWLKEHPTITVFMADTHAPFSFLDENDQVNGLSVALLEMIERRTGIHFEYQHFNNMFQMKNRLAQNGDAIIAVADATGERNDHVAFSRSYTTSPWVLVTRKDYKEVKSLADIDGHSIAVYQGAWFIDDLKKKYPHINFIESKFHIETSDWLQENKIDGVIMPYFPASFFLNNIFPDRYRIAAVLPIDPVRLAMAFNKNNPMLRSIINKALVDIPPETIQAQVARWQSSAPPAKISSWNAYREYIVRILVVSGAIVIFFLWRNALLRRNLAQQKKHELQLQLARDEADKANESKSIFLSQMSHEIRTPLNALTGLLELESLGKSTPLQREHNIEIAWDASKSLLLLVSDILDLAKIESGSLAVKKSPISLPDTINAVMGLFEKSARDKNIELIATLELAQPDVLFDRSMLRQIISNLVSNAIKFTEAGQVEIALYQGEMEDGQASYILEVCDTGPGLTAQQQVAIFEPFVQVQNGRTPHSGTGLGLSICRQLAGMLNGTLSVESEVGEGATFIFRFKAVPCDSIPEPQSIAEIRSATRPKNILIVDDHAPNRLLLSQQLEYAGHHTIAVESGEHAISAWNASVPDIVITDCNMPGMDGFELTRQLRKKEQAAGIPARPIFGLTAMAENEVITRTEAAGMTACLFKPIELRRLLAHIGEVQSSSSVPVSEPTSTAILALQKLTKNNPQAFRELAETIIEQNQTDIQHIKMSCSNNDLAGAKHAAHQILGGARMINADELAALCKQIENSIDKKDAEAINHGIQECERLVQDLDLELRKALILLTEEQDLSQKTPFP
jgi:two-component system sensor histidine kinase EvgS